MAKSSKIPGYEQLTRPEEISALSKYLKKRRQDLEDSLYLQEDNLEVPGRQTGKVPKIKSLPDSYESLKVSGALIPKNQHGEPEELYDAVLEAPENQNGQPEELYDSVLGMEENKNEEPTELESKVVELKDDRDQELSAHRENLEVSKDIALSEHLESLEKERAKDIELQNEKINLSGPKDIKINLENQGEKISRVRGGEVEIPSLGNEKEKLNVDIENNLDSTKVDLISSSHSSPDSLEKSAVGIGGKEKEISLEEGSVALGEVKEIDQLETGKEKIYDSRETALSRQISKIIDSREPRLEGKVEGKPENQHKEVITLEEFKSNYLNALGESAEKLSDEELYTRIIKLLSTKGEFGYAPGGDWEDKIAALVSTYLSGEGRRISPEKAAEFETQLGKTLVTLDVASGMQGRISIPGVNEFDTLMTKLGLSRWLAASNDEKIRQSIPSTQIGTNFGALSYLNVNNYIRWTAENIANATPQAGGNTKRLLIEEAIAALILYRTALEKSTKTNRDRLPGESNGWGLNSLMQGGASGLVKESTKKLKQATKNLLSGTTGPKPTYNRPEVKDGKATREEQVYQSYGENGNSKIVFSNSYGQGEGIKTTLKDLCNYSGKTESLNQVISQLNNDSSFITTWEKAKKNLTLDTNSYWEVLLEPYVGSLNGETSYLPSIQEINILNNRLHGVQTAYNGWIPFTSFELSKSKVNTKSVGLYDGEIVFPVSMEFTNELRLSIIDDQYKSWRNYFQKCADVSIYNSEPHKVGFYSKDGAEITAVDKTNICPAFYQNLAFRIRIYVMTPQYSTIRKFDLLCVLKDYMEEFSGDIDAGAGDLNVAFSIVGENPDTDNLLDDLQLTKENRPKKTWSIFDRDKINSATAPTASQGGIISN